MRQAPLDEARRWLAQAKQSLSDAVYARDGGRHHLACFLSQQAAELAVKGYLYAQGMEDPWGHSVAELCDAAVEFNPDFATIRGDCASLDKHYIPTRYPNGLPGGIPADAFDADDSAAAVSRAETILGFVTRAT